MKLNTRLLFALLLLFGAVAVTSCTDDSSDVNAPVPSEPVNPDSGDDDDNSDDAGDLTLLGLSCSPEEPNADQELKITFAAPTTSALYGYAGDVYAHIGVVDEGTWLYVQAEWEENTSKCQMTLEAENTWSLTLSPTVREWFASEQTALKQIGIVIRSSDSSLKGIDSDSFITVTDDLYTGFVAAAAVEQSMPAGLEDGINVIDNGTITFVLHGADLYGNMHDFAHIVGDFNGWELSNTTASQMYRDSAEGCWWITVEGLDKDTEYAFQYYLGYTDGETLRTGDPYAQKILDPDNDPWIAESTYPAADRVYPEGGRGIVSVARIAADDYVWSSNDFEIEDPDNLIIYELLLRDFTDTSDINGARAKLDYIASLGVNAIELMPVQEFDGNDSWGYSPSYFFALDKAYGTVQDYKAFIDECHQRGIAVILDVVYNHATGNNAMAKLHWDSSNSKTAYNNPYFNVDAPHPYSVFQDFNHENERVRSFIKRNLKFLLEEYKVDGFRFDLTKGFTQTESTESTASNYDASRIAILKDYHSAVVEASPNAVMILEHFCATVEEQELANAGMKVWRNANYAYSQAAMGWSSDSGFDYIYSSSSMPFGSCVGYMESHDEERMAYSALTYGDTAIKSDINARMGNLASSAVFSLLVPGPKMIWQFGEMGYDVSIDYNDRTGRKPIYWEYLDDESRAELVATYSALGKLRTSHPTLFAAEATFSWQATTSYWSGGRTLQLESTDGKKLFAVANFTSSQITSTESLPSGWGAYYDLMSGVDYPYLGGSTITLEPNSFKVYTSFEIN